LSVHGSDEKGIPAIRALDSSYDTKSFFDNSFNEPFPIARKAVFISSVLAIKNFSAAFFPSSTLNCSLSLPLYQTTCVGGSNGRGVID